MIINVMYACCPILFASSSPAKEHNCDSATLPVVNIINVVCVRCSSSSSLVKNILKGNLDSFYGKLAATVLHYLFSSPSPVKNILKGNPDSFYAKLAKVQNCLQYSTLLM